MSRQFTSPVKPMTGQPVKADHMQNHARAIEELQRALYPSTINKNPRINQTPLLLINAGLDSGGDALIQITSGYVNLEMPTLGGTALDAATPPTIVVDADKYVYVKCVGTFGSPDTYVVTIHTEATDTPPTEAISATGFTSYYPLGFAIFNATGDITLTLIHSGGNLGIESFGSINLWWNT